MKPTKKPMSFVKKVWLSLLLFILSILLTVIFLVIVIQHKVDTHVTPPIIDYEIAFMPR
jgi:heme/copper-type cytochrome/quinol oxidase subunit 4